VVHDCGTVINPLILAGQIHGRRRTGIGNAFYEQLMFDEHGQLLNPSLAEYLLPTALDVRVSSSITPRCVAAQSARDQGRGRGRRYSGRTAVRAGDRGCASIYRARE
jgi:xanthine dehydrogenase molybdopterin-binding subunit B